MDNLITIKNSKILVIFYQTIFKHIDILENLCYNNNVSGGFMQVV